jgi:hypothetical protein
MEIMIMLSRGQASFVEKRGLSLSATWGLAFIFSVFEAFLNF